MAKNKENQILHLKTSNQYYCHTGTIIHGPFTSACQNKLPKDVQRERVKMIKKMDFVKMAENEETKVNLCPHCLEILKPQKQKIVNPKSAFYTYKNMSGEVSLKADGKISITINGRSSRYSYTEKYQFKKLGNEIAEADFVHPAITRLTENNIVGLVEILTKETQPLKRLFIEQTKLYANNYFLLAQEEAELSDKQWLDKYKIEYTIEERYGSKGISIKNYNKRYYALKAKRSEFQRIVSLGKEKYETEQLLWAERHYEDSIIKLSMRLNEKGIKDDTEIKIKSGRVGINFELEIEHNNTITKAWTIEAWGPIQRPHYRYLVR